MCVSADDRPLIASFVLGGGGEKGTTCGGPDGGGGGADGEAAAGSVGAGDVAEDALLLPPQSVLLCLSS